MNKVITFLLVFCLTLCCSNLYAAQWLSPLGGHRAAWKMIWAVDLGSGGMGKKLPNPVTKTGELKLKEIHDFIDCNDGHHRGSGLSKRYGITHNPIYVAQYFNSLYGWNYRAIVNAVAVHNILDMTTNDVNGHKQTPDKKKTAEKRWDDILKKKPVRHPDWSTEPGPRITYEKDKIKGNATAKAKVIKTNKIKAKKMAKSKAFREAIEDAGKKTGKYAKPVATVIAIYETGKTISDYAETGEFDAKKFAVNASGAVGGWAGAEAGATLGVISCTPASGFPPGYVLCVAAFTTAGGIAGEMAMQKVGDYVYDSSDKIVEYVKENPYTILAISIPNTSVLTDTNHPILTGITWYFQYKASIERQKRQQGSGRKLRLGFF